MHDVMVKHLIVKKATTCIYRLWAEIPAKCLLVPNTITEVTIWPPMATKERTKTATLPKTNKALEQASIPGGK